MSLHVFLSSELDAGLPCLQRSLVVDVGSARLQFRALTEIPLWPPLPFLAILKGPSAVQQYLGGHQPSFFHTPTSASQGLPQERKQLHTASRKKATVFIFTNRENTSRILQSTSGSNTTTFSFRNIAHRRFGKLLGKITVIQSLPRW